MENPTMSAPTAFSMLEAFGIDPIESQPEEGFFAYEWRDAVGLRLRLSWHIIERSVQVTLYLGVRELITVCQECATLLRVDPVQPPTITAEFRQAGVSGHLRCVLSPEIRVSWSNLNND